MINILSSSGLRSLNDGGKGIPQRILNECEEEEAVIILPVHFSKDEAIEALEDLRSEILKFIP